MFHFILLTPTIEIFYLADRQPKEEQLINGNDTVKDGERKLHSHPLFFGITMGLLAEIINSRLQSLNTRPCNFPPVYSDSDTVTYCCHAGISWMD